MDFHNGEIQAAELQAEIDKRDARIRELEECVRKLEADLVVAPAEAATITLVLSPPERFIPCLFPGEFELDDEDE